MASPKLSSFPPRKSSPGAAREPLGVVLGLPGVSASELLARLARLAERVSGFRVCDEAAPRAAVNDAASELAEELARALELLRVLERLNQTAAEDEEFVFDEEQDPETRPRLIVTRPVAPKIADVCFAGTFELNRARLGLLRSQGADEALAAVETALRKLRRVIYAVLQAAQAEGTGNIGSVEHLRRVQSADLRASLAVRRLYAEFRQALRRPEAHDAEAVLKALRYAAGALAVLVASPPYANARASDRALLRRLQERLLAWSRNGRDVELGLQLLDDVWTCADLLRDVNRRQELRAHDAAVIEALLESSERQGSHFLGQLGALLGLDDELDLLIALLKSSPSADAVQRLLAELERLR